MLILKEFLEFSTDDSRLEEVLGALSPEEAIDFLKKLNGVKLNFVNILQKLGFIKIENPVDAINRLIREQEVFLIGSCHFKSDKTVYPNIRAILQARKCDTGGILSFSTNTSSEKVKQFSFNPNACVYIYDVSHFMAVMFEGKMNVSLDPEVKKTIWRRGDEKYYKKGILDPDFCVLTFYPQTGNFYFNTEIRKFGTEIISQILPFQK